MSGRFCDVMMMSPGRCLVWPDLVVVWTNVLNVGDTAFSVCSQHSKRDGDREDSGLGLGSFLRVTVQIVLRRLRSLEPSWRLSLCKWQANSSF